MTAPNSYGKKEKLKSRKHIEALFSKGKSFSVFPVKVIFSILPVAGPSPVHAGVGASARHFKKAVHRNRIKRLLREAYRLQKAILLEEAIKQNKCIDIFFLYVGKELPEQSLITEKLGLALNKLAAELKR